MTPANTQTDAPAARDTPRVSDAFKPAWREIVNAQLAELSKIIRRSPEWVVIVFAWFAAAFIPAFWNMVEDNWWSSIDSPLFFQPFVPLFCAALFWQDRDKLQAAWQRTSRTKRRGSPWVLYVGCFVVLVSHLIHVIFVAAIGLLIVAVGVVYLAYGAQVLKESRRALLFGLLLVPPPSTVAALIRGIFGVQTWKVVTIALQKFGKIASMATGVKTISLVLDGQVYAVPYTASTVVMVTGFLLLFIAVWRREKIGNALILMASGALLAVFLLVLIPVVVLLLPVTPLTGTLIVVHPALLIALATGITVAIRGRLGAWGGSLSQGSRALGKLGQAAQKATDRAASGVASGVDGSVGRVGRGVTKGTEAFIDRMMTAITKPFKRKGRDRR